jgi:glycosidase
MFTHPLMFRMRLMTACLVATLALPSVGAERLRLHVPSPDWRDQVIYFAMTDRFDDGDPRNDDQGAGEYDPRDGRKYSGGDLRGLLRRLDYIKGLGATALWITPPVANQWWDGRKAYGGYHGYWAENFVHVDRHLGSLGDYRHLSDALHRSQMFLVQDIVLNHTGNFFGYDGPWQPGEPTQHFTMNSRSRPVTAPSQWPFSLDDPRRRRDRAAAIYHWAPDITDYGDPRQVLDFQMSGLDDLNTENPRVRDALRDSYAYWIREVGVDAFRLDTAFYVPTDFLRDFMDHPDPHHPGIAQAAQATGRRDFLVFGEGFGIDKPGEDVQMRRIERYMHDPNGRSVLPSMLNFPLYGSLADVLARGAPPSELGERITRMVALHPRLHWMPSFLDNHDVDRFLASGSVPALQQGLLMLMTLPGIPVIYYGAEQGFTQQRAAMFAGGWGSGGRDHFDTQSPLYRYVRSVIALRHEHRLLSRGDPTVLRADEAAPGALAYAVRDGEQTALVVFNTADRPTLLDRLPTGLPPGTRLQPLFATGASQAEQQVDAHGELTLRLAPRAGLVWLAQAPRAGADEKAPAASMPATGDDRVTLDPPPGTTDGDSVTISGQAPGARAVQMIVDGQLDAARTIPVDPDGHWRATVDTQSLSDLVSHRIVALRPDSGAVSAAQALRLHRHWTLHADVTDPAGDDHGPSGRYTYPTDAVWRTARPLDLRRVQVWSSGARLKITVAMNQVVARWNPPNGFDHVAFTLFVQLPGTPGGATVMPGQHAQLPEGMRWHLRLRVSGWTNALFGWQGASDTQEGTPLALAAEVEADAASNTVSFTLPAAALSLAKNLQALKLYVSTWDYDAGFRALAAEPGGTTFGGGTADAARVMDDSLVTLQ